MNFAKILIPAFLICVISSCNTTNASYSDYQVCKSECAISPGENKNYFPDLKGKLIRVGKIKLVIAEFFHPLCTPCQDSVECLNKLYKRNDVEIIGITHVKEEAIKKFIDEFKPEYEIWQASKDLFVEMQVDSVPVAFIYREIDKKILWQGHPMDINNKLLEKLLTADP